MDDPTDWTADMASVEHTDAHREAAGARSRYEGRLYAGADDVVKGSDMRDDERYGELHPRAETRRDGTPRLVIPPRPVRSAEAPARAEGRPEWRDGPHPMRRTAPSVKAPRPPCDPVDPVPLHGTGSDKGTDLDGTTPRRGSEPGIAVPVRAAPGPSSPSTVTGTPRTGDGLDGPTTAAVRPPATRPHGEAPAPWSLARSASDTTKRIAAGALGLMIVAGVIAYATRSTAVDANTNDVTAAHAAAGKLAGAAPMQGDRGVRMGAASEVASSGGASATAPLPAPDSAGSGAARRVAVPANPPTGRYETAGGLPSILPSALTRPLDAPRAQAEPLRDVTPRASEAPVAMAKMENAPPEAPDARTTAPAAAPDPVPVTTRIAQLSCPTDGHAQTTRRQFSAAIWKNARDYEKALTGRSDKWTGKRNMMILFDETSKPSVAPPASIRHLAFDKNARPLPTTADVAAAVWVAVSQKDMEAVDPTACTLQLVSGD